MVFGEVVIPSSRSLWDDDAEFTEEEPAKVVWDQEIVLPYTIDTLIIADTKAIITLFQACVIEQLQPIRTAKESGLQLFNLNGRHYLLIYENKPSISSGEIIFNIEDLIKKASKVYGITSLPTAMYQGEERLEERTIFSLSTLDDTLGYPRLQIPNIVTGICANLLSYCIHTGQSCTAFVSFLETAPLDSINTEQLTDLFKLLGIDGTRSYSMIMRAPSNNLYM